MEIFYSPKLFKVIIFPSWGQGTADDSKNKWICYNWPAPSLWTSRKQWFHSHELNWKSKCCSPPLGKHGIPEEKARSQTASAGTIASTDLTQVHPKARTVGQNMNPTFRCYCYFEKIYFICVYVLVCALYFCMCLRLCFVCAWVVYACIPTQKPQASAGSL